MESELGNTNFKSREECSDFLHALYLDVSNPRVKARNKQQLERMMHSESSASRPVGPFANPFADPASLPPLPMSRPSTPSGAMLALTAAELHPEPVNPFLDTPSSHPDTTYQPPSKLASNNPFADPDLSITSWSSPDAVPEIPLRNPRRVKQRPHLVIPRDIVPVTVLDNYVPSKNGASAKRHKSNKYSNTSAISWDSSDETHVQSPGGLNTSMMQPSPISETGSQPYCSTPKSSPKLASSGTFSRSTNNEARYPDLKPATKKSPTSYSSERELQALKTAQKQDLKLRAARSAHRYNLAISLPRNSPTLLYSPHHHPHSHNKTKNYSLLRSPTFYISLLLMQLGIISTGASFAVLIRNKKVGESIGVGTGTAFWLVCSLVAFLVGFGVCVVVVLHHRGKVKGKGGRWGWVGYLGLEEVVRASGGRTGGSGDVELTQVVRDAVGNGDGGFEGSPHVRRPVRIPDFETRHQANGGGCGGDDSIISMEPQLKNPAWMALYTHPEQVKTYISRVEHPVHNSELLNLENSDIGVQVLVPTPVGFDSPARNPVSPLEGRRIKSRNGHDSILPSQSASMLPHTRATIPNLKKAKEFVNVDLEGETLVHNHSHVSDYNNASPTSPTFPISTEVSQYSPLEGLARDLNGQAVLQMAAHERQDYIAQRRVRSEERGRRVRLSLEGEGRRSLARRPTVQRRGREIRVEDEVGLGGDVEMDMMDLRAGSSSSANSKGSGDGSRGGRERNGVRDGKTSGRGRDMKTGSNVERLKKMWEAVDECFADNDGKSVVREKVVIKGTQKSERKVNGEGELGQGVFIVGEE